MRSRPGQEAFIIWRSFHVFCHETIEEIPIQDSCPEHGCENEDTLNDRFLVSSILNGIYLETDCGSPGCVIPL
jgi:hypothetical protein